MLARLSRSGNIHAFLAPQRISWVLSSVVSVIAVATEEMQDVPILVSSDRRLSPSSSAGKGEIKIVTEVMGGLHPAKEYISEALSAGKYVITANKDLMTVFGSELIKLAQDNHCDLMYNASVAGGIPILRKLSDSYVGDHILEIQGIVNGTTNYILSQMDEKGLSYAAALKRAKELTQKGIVLPCCEPLQFFLRNKISLAVFDKSVLDKFSYLDDYDVLGAIKVWQFHDDFVLQSLCRMILNRDLLKIQMSDDKPNKENLLAFNDLSPRLLHRKGIYQGHNQSQFHNEPKARI